MYNFLYMLPIDIIQTVYGYRNWALYVCIIFFIKLPNNFFMRYIYMKVILSAPASSVSIKRIFSSFLASTLRYGIALVTRKQQSWYFVTGFSKGLYDLAYWWLTYQMDWFNCTCVKDVRDCYGSWLKDTSKLLLNWKKCKRLQYTVLFYIYVCNI